MYGGVSMPEFLYMSKWDGGGQPQNPPGACLLGSRHVAGTTCRVSVSLWFRMFAMVLLMNSRSSSSLLSALPGVLLSSCVPVSGGDLRRPGEGDLRFRGLVPPRLLLRWCLLRLGGDGVVGLSVTVSVGRGRLDWSGVKLKILLCLVAPVLVLDCCSISSSGCGAGST